MQVILLENIRRVGKIGDSVEVKNGYARNFLLPREKALRATKDNLELFEQKKAEIEAKNDTKKAAAKVKAEKFKDVKVSIICQASEDGRLYGSVNTRDVAQGINAQGIEITHNELTIDAPIKTLGIHELTVELHSEVSTTIKINIARTKSEAEEQWKLGKSSVQAKLDEAQAAKTLEQERALSRGQKSEEKAEGEEGSEEATAEAEDSEGEAKTEEVQDEAKSA